MNGTCGGTERSFSVEQKAYFRSYVAHYLCISVFAQFECKPAHYVRGSRIEYVLTSGLIAKRNAATANDRKLKAQKMRNFSDCSV